MSVFNDPLLDVSEPAGRRNSEDGVFGHNYCPKIVRNFDVSDEFQQMKRGKAAI